VHGAVCEDVDLDASRFKWMNSDLLARPANRSAEFVLRDFQLEQGGPEAEAEIASTAIRASERRSTWCRESGGWLLFAGRELRASADGNAQDLDGPSATAR